MALDGAHTPNQSGHVADHNLIDAALTAKAPSASPAFTGTPTGITKAHVGLSNVDNTADVNKPVSTAQAAAFADHRASPPNPNDVRAAAALTYLTTPTPDGTGKAVHPDVCFVPDGWNGKKWWMCYTPYANSDNALENPCVVSSDDGHTWAPPAGLTNPVEPKPVGGFNTDNEIILDHDGTMVLFFRVCEGGNETLVYRTSVDGETWAPKIQSLQVAGGVYRGMVSPSITWDGHQWCLFYVDTVLDPGPSTIKKRTSATLRGTWSAAVDTTITLPNSRWGTPQQAWHLDVVWTAGYFHALVTTGDATVHDSTSYALSFAISTNGIDWTAAAYPLWYVKGNGTTWDSLPYRGCLVPLADGRWRIYYSASGTDSWHIGKVDTYTGPYSANNKFAVGDTFSLDAPTAALEVRPLSDIPVIAGRRSPAASTSPLIDLYNAAASIVLFRVTANGGALVGSYSGVKAGVTGLGVFGHSEFQNNLSAAVAGGSLFLGDASNGGGTGVFAIKNATTPPPATPTGGGVLYVEAGALKYKGSSGTVTVIAPA